MTTKNRNWELDIRVRERLLKSGALTAKDVEKYTAELPDLAEQADAVSLAQPAIAGREEN